MVVRPSCNWAHGRTGWDRVELQRWNLPQPELGSLSIPMWGRPSAVALKGENQDGHAETSGARTPPDAR